MPSRIFEYHKDLEPENCGWRPVNFPNGGTTDSATMVHDILEHFPRDPLLSDVEDEILALGASLHIREDYFGLKHGLNIGLTYKTAEDLVSLLGDVVFGDQVLQPLKSYQRRGSRLASYVEWCAQLGVFKFKTFNRGTDDDSEATATAAINERFGSEAELRKRLECWLLRGARQAKCRYRNRDGSAMWSDYLCSFFVLAERELEIKLALMRASGRVRVSLQPTTGKVSVSVVEDPVLSI